MTTSKLNIGVERISILPFGPDDRAAHETDNFELFDGSTEFKRKGMKYLAIALQLEKLSTARRAVSHSFTATVVNIVTSEAVSARSFSVRIGADSTSLLYRTNVPLKADMVNERYVYEVRVTSMRDGRVCATSPLSFVAEKNEASKSDEPDFDKLLDDFISSQMAKEDDEEAKIEETKTALDSLNELIGLTNVKRRVRSLYNVSRFFRMRSDAGLTFSRPPLHALFLGSPGTGKTTVARIMGQLLKEAGVLSSGHVVMRERNTIVGKHYGDEEKAVREAIDEAQGGILFIDEAYQLWREDDPKDPGRIALESMLTALSDSERRDWMLILAGYTEPTLNLLKLNPGLASRIPASNHYVFEDYTAAELELIADKYLADNQFAISDEARALLGHLLHHDWASRDASFGNARHVLNLLETGVLPAMAERVVGMASPQISDLQTIVASDIPAPSLKPMAMRRRLGFAV